MYIFSFESFKRNPPVGRVYWDCWLSFVTLTVYLLSGMASCLPVRRKHVGISFGQESFVLPQRSRINAKQAGLLGRFKTIRELWVQYLNSPTERPYEVVPKRYWSCGIRSEGYTKIKVNGRVKTTVNFRYI